MKEQEIAVLKKEPLSLQANVLWNTIGTSIYLGCQWLITILVVRLSTDFTNSGLLTIAMAVSNIFYGIAIYNMRSYQVSDVTGKYSDTVYIQMRLTTSFIALFCCLIYSIICYRDSRLVCILLYMFFKVLEAVVDVFHGIDQKAGYMNIIGTSMTLRGIGCLVIFALLLSKTDSLNLAIIGMILVSLLCIICYDLPRSHLFFTYEMRIHLEEIKRLLIECLPLGIAYSLSSATISLPRSMLDFMEGSDFLGIYGAIATPAMIVQVMASYIFSPLLSTYALYYYEKNRVGFYRLLKQTLLLLVGLSAATLIAAYFLKDWGLSLLLEKKILPYTYLFMPMLVGTILNSFVNLITNLLIVVRRFQIYLIGTALAALLSVVLSPLFIRIFSMNGVNITIILVMLLQIILFSAALNREFKKHFYHQTRGENHA